MSVPALTAITGAVLTCCTILALLRGADRAASLALGTVILREFGLHLGDALALPHGYLLWIDLAGLTALTWIALRFERRFPLILASLAIIATIARILEAAELIKNTSALAHMLRTVSFGMALVLLFGLYRRSESRLALPD